MKQDTQATSRRQNDFCPCRACCWEGLHDDACSVHDPVEEQAAYLDGVLPYCDCGLRAKVRARTQASTASPPQPSARRPRSGGEGYGAAPRVVIADDLDDARTI